MMSKTSKNLNTINNNQVKIQNWRNDIITKYAKKGNDVVEVVEYVDEEIIPQYKRFFPDNFADVSVPKIEKSTLKSMEVKLSIRFPPLSRSH